MWTAVALIICSLDAVNYDTDVCLSNVDSSDSTAVWLPII